VRVLVKLPNWVGDSVMATPALDFLREQLPQAEIIGIARSAVGGVLQGHPSLNEIITADERWLPPAIATQLLEKPFDAVALMTNSLGSAWFALRRVRSRIRVGYARGGRRLLLTHAIPFHRPDWQTPAPLPISARSRVNGIGHPGHMVQYYSHIAEAAVKALGIDAETDRLTLDTPLTLPRSAEVKTAMDQLLQEHNPGRLPMVAINPGAAYGGAKRWPLKSLVAAGEHCAAALGGVLVSTASPFETALNDELASYARTNLLRLGEHLDLPMLIELMRRSTLFFTNDSGAMHIAAAAQTPTVAIFGPTDWNVTYPWSRRAVVVRQSPPCAPCLLRECPIDHICMTEIDTHRVASAGLDLLNELKAAGGV